MATSTVPRSFTGLRAVSAPLRDGDAGTEQTIAAIRAKLQEAFADPSIRAAAIAIARSAPPMNAAAQVQAVYQWVVQNIRFVNDPPGHELVQAADFTLLHRAGDCDCITTLVLSLLGGMGIDGDLVTVATDPERPNEFSHIYPRAYTGNQTIAVDAARELETGKPSFGKEPTAYYRKRIWDLAPGGSYQDFPATATPPALQSSGNGLGRFLSTGRFAMGSRSLYGRPAPGLAGGRLGYALKSVAPRHRLRGTGLGQDPGDYTTPADFLQANPDEYVYDPSTNTSVTLNDQGQYITIPGTPEDGSTVVPITSWSSSAASTSPVAAAASTVTYTTSTGQTVNLPAALTAAGNAAASALRAANSPYGAIPGYPGYQVMANGQIVSPTGQVLSASTLGLTSSLSTLFSSPTTVILIVVAVVLVAAEGKK
jgi:hypothetical protein